MINLEEELDRSFCSSKNVLHPSEYELNQNKNDTDGENDDDYDENEDINDISNLSHEMTLYSCHKRMR